MATIPSESLNILRSAPEVQSVAKDVMDGIDKVTAATVINSAANAGQTSCVIEQSLKPETIQDLIDNGYTIQGIGRADKNLPLLVDWSRSVTSSVAGDYSEVSKHSPIYNKKTIGDYIWVEMPSLAKHFSLTTMSMIQPSEEPVDDISGVIQENIWLKVPTDILDLTAGSKVYKIILTHKCIEDQLSLYFGYSVQDDTPDKPYVYMK